jgi:hypothetical protein
VIGVGHYPHLEGGTSPRPDTMGLGQLSSPPVSALEIAEWLKTRYNNVVAPLATLRVLVSGHDGPATFNNDKGQPVVLDRAEMTTVATSIHDWAAAADSDTGNIALFYFCGHGVSAGINNGLLLEDFGADHRDLALLQNVIDIDNLHLAMDGVHARKQCFFIDACRNTPKAIADRAGRGALGQSILDPTIKQGRYGARDAPMFFACLPSQKAYGLAQGTSLFTRALLETLACAGAVNRGGVWTVRTDTMLPALNETLRWQGPQYGLPSQPAYLDHASGFDLHWLEGPPAVPVSVNCNPEAAHAAATLSVIGPNGRHIRDQPGSRPWWLRCKPGAYDVEAAFPKGPYKVTTHTGRIVVPPYAEIDLDVTP